MLENNKEEEGGSTYQKSRRQRPPRTRRSLVAPPLLLNPLSLLNPLRLKSLQRRRDRPRASLQTRLCTPGMCSGVEASSYPIKADRLRHHLTLGWRVKYKKRKCDPGSAATILNEMRQWTAVETNVHCFRGGLVFKARKLLCHSYLGLNVKTKKKKCTSESAATIHRQNASSRVNLSLEGLEICCLSPLSLAFLSLCLSQV